ncbi:hypothetical protein [Vibrio alfacsensis]|uniref:hypothetical protein n=1 Tax=Vibrio TaxID=662 RepID=UPI004068BD96
MEPEKLSVIGTRLFSYEIETFLIGVSSGQIVPDEHSENWSNLKRRVQSNKATDVEVRQLVEMCNYEPLTLVYELMDELPK